MKSGDAGESGGGFDGLREILVLFQTNRDSNFWFCLTRIGVLHGRSGGFHHAQDVSTAAHAHARAESNFGGHAERDFNFCALLKRDISKEENTTRTEVLRETNTFNGGRDLAKGKRKKVCKPLSDAAFNMNWRSGHSGRITSLPRTIAAQRKKIAPSL
jgi:hypothetical protein